MSSKKHIFSSADRRSKLISAPTNFNHISHMGPGEGIQKQRLIDLATTISSVDQPQPYAQRMHPPKMGPLPPKHSDGRRRPEISNPTPIARPNFPPYNGAKRTAPPRPRDLPPSLPRGVPGPVEGGMDRAITPSSLGSMSSLHDMIKVCGFCKHFPM